jgi:hypothetical protein
MSKMTVPPLRPSLVLRVGITGARDLSDDQLPRLGDQVAEILRLVRQEAEQLAAKQAARAAYAQEPDGAVRTAFRCLSPLAEGADRLAAQAAHDEGFSLIVPMPFAQAEYEKDFRTDASVEQFRDMLAWAGEDRLELDGARDRPADGIYDEARSYEAVGRFIVRNCDVLIAIWDGKPPKGRGGTFDTVRFAAEAGTPVWWIHAEQPAEPVWLNDTVEPRPNRAVTPAGMELRRYLARLILPPTLARPHHRHSFIERLTHSIRPTPPAPHLAYLQERALPANRLWQAHAWLLRTAASWRPPKAPERPTPSDPVAIAWNASYSLPDDLAYGHGQRYRSVYVWVFALVALSLFCASTSLALQIRWVGWLTACGEAVALLLILALLVVNTWRDWHQHWIDYRLLAELCRKQQALAPLGWSLPGRAIATLAEEADDEHAEPDRAAWVAWFFGAIMRATPLPRGRFDAARLEDIRRIVLDDLVLDQLHYHGGRLAQYDKAGRRLVRIGEGLFAVVAILVLGKLWLMRGGHEPPVWLEWLTIVLPTFGAAFVGIRAYAELQLLAGQSRHMSGVMRRAAERLGKLDLTQPLASQELGAITHGVAITMLQEVDGWARMFRVKVVEAG